MQSTANNAHDYSQGAPKLHVLPASQIFLLPGLYFVMHTVEELPSFAQWVSRHFGTMSTDVFAFIHIPLILIILLAAYKAFTIGHHGGWVILATAAQWQFGLNAVFHLVTAVIFREYSPGMVTAVCLSFPFTVYFMRRIWQEQRITRAELATAIVVGTVMAVVAIGFLFLH
jgi:hypothetical protein